MKRFLTITAAVLLLAAISFWGYIRYRQHASYSTLIPANAGVLIRVDVYRLYQSLSGSLFKRRRSERRFFKGLSIPANIFCYTLKGLQGNTLFATLPVDDTGALARSLPGMGFSRDPAAPGGITFARNGNQTCILAYNGDRIAFAFPPGKENVTETLGRLLRQEDMIPVAESAFSKIKEQEGHITLLSEKGKGRLDFQQGAIVAALQWKAESLQTQEIPQPEANNGNALTLYWLGLAPDWLEGKQFRIKDISISGDSLLAAHPHGFIFEVGKTTVQKDSVISYDYNDDFEKVATVSVKESRVPGLRLQLLADAPLYTYLQRIGILSRDSNTVRHKLFPLYKVHTGTAPGTLWASTATEAPLPLSLAKGPFVFLIRADFDQLKQVPDLAWLNRYTAPFTSLSGVGRQLRDKTIDVSMKLNCRKKDESSLLQLPFLF
ncbi:hypothetical protein [Taibaiella koreensis]|uniref:hypothetical protein n=1 Tax=Taibaiella koreensis TaxID=1268548 RepID=UPI000E59D96E|nr:hypothetical protein [Taibaiella koreensis]